MVEGICGVLGRQWRIERLIDGLVWQARLVSCDDAAFQTPAVVMLDTTCWGEGDNPWLPWVAAQ